MAKKKKTAQSIQPVKEQKETPSFEIGVKGDDFDRKYRRAALSSTASADRLLNELSRESRADKYNFMGFAIPALLILIIGLSLTVISRGDIEQQFNVKPSLATVINGEYFKNLNEVYERTVPFKDSAVKLCAALGLREALPEEEPVPDEEPTLPKPNVTPEPEVTSAAEPAKTTVSEEIEPEATTAPAETEPPVTVQTGEPEPESYVTFTMYASATVNIRLGPSTEDAILGNYVQNDEVEVIAIRQDGWAEVLYGEIKAYVYAEYLSESEVEVTTARRRSRSEATTAEPNQTAFSDDGGDITSVPEDDSGEQSPDDNGEEDSDDSITLEDEPSDGGGQSPNENGENL